MKSISVVINTCALGPRSREVTGSCSSTPHAARTFALRHFIIPRYVDDPFISEVIVVGEWEPGEDYTYIPHPSEHFSCVDALSQRQAGFDASSGEIAVFTHDDHIFAADAFSFVAAGFEGDVILPTRLKRTSGGVKVLPNGSAEGYVSGHASIMKREMATRAPWSEVEKIHTWDLSHTNLLIREGAHVISSPQIRVYDVELGGA